MRLGRAALRQRGLALALFLVASAAAAQADVPLTTGSFSVSATATDILGDERAELFAAAVPADETIEWHVVVPDDYSPSRPAGLLVYVSPSMSGALPRGWAPVLARHNLIWVAANDSGNRVSVARRVAYAVLAAGLIGDRYRLEKERVLVGGFSGGAKVSGLLAAQFPDLFHGGLYIGGAERWEAGTRAANIERMKQNRYVFLAGREDFNLPLARRVRSQYEAAGIDRTELIIVPRTGHDLPSPRRLAPALEFLLAAGPE